MEDFIAKPVEPGNLFSTIIKWLPEPADTSYSNERLRPDGVDNKVVFPQFKRIGRSTSVVDPEALTLIFADDHSAQLDVLRKFVVQTDEIYHQFESAFGQRDLEEVRFHSHKLKSSARTVGANHLADLCFALETAARNRKWSEIDALTGDLQAAIEAVKNYVNGF
jgi:HPt (histidine-containing phosphotransfer) domain-containing protein